MRATRAGAEWCTRARLPDRRYPLVDGVHRAGSAFQQGGKDHDLEEISEPRLIEPRQQVVRRQRFAGNGGHECAHAYEEEERRQHRQRARGDARNNGIAVAREMARDRQDDHRADDVVAGVGQAARQPSVIPAVRGCEGLRNAAAERRQGEYDECGVDAVEQDGNPGENAFDALVSECGSRSRSRPSGTTCRRSGAHRTLPMRSRPRRPRTPRGSGPRRARRRFRIPAMRDPGARGRNCGSRARAVVARKRKSIAHTTHQITVATAIAAIPPQGPAGRKNSAISRPVA